MAKKIMAKVGSYQHQGQTKNKWVQLGVVMENKSGGEYIMLDPSVNLAGVLIQQRLSDPQKSGERVLASIFEDKPRGQDSNYAKDSF